MSITKIRIVLRILVLVLLALLAWVAFQPPLRSPNVSIKLLGYTNVTGGDQLAMIAVTNLSDSKVLVYMPRIEIPAPTEPRGFAYSGDMIQWHSMLGRGQSGNFIIHPPTNRSPWKLSFYVYNDFGAAQVIKRIITASPRRMPFEIESDWIDRKK